MAKSLILTSSLKIMIPIIKVVGDFCNLRCRYCFYNSHNQLTPRVMSEDLLEKFIREYMDIFKGRLTFIWHGGEPLLAGLSFFERVIAFQKANLGESSHIHNTIQTNATLINKDWAQFFKAHNFRVGVSLDGSRESHNRFRLTYGGKGSFDRVMEGIDILRWHGIEPGIIQTLTYDSLPDIQENFHFFTKILSSKGWGINACLDIKRTNQAMLGQDISNEELTEFLKIYIDLWLAQNDGNLRIREIENFLAGVLGRRASNCTFNGACTGYFCLEYDGRVYPCDRLSNQPEFLFGNLSQQSLFGILNSPIRLKYAEKVNSLHPDCGVCEWQVACHNGCAHHRQGSVSGKYYYCETRKTIFAYLQEKVIEYNNL